jgi:hypothetical protein
MGYQKLIYIACYLFFRVAKSTGANNANTPKVWADWKTPTNFAVLELFFLADREIILARTYIGHVL